MTIYELDVILATAANAAVVRLTGESIALIGAALTSMQYRYAWEDAQDDSTWDLIESFVADAHEQIWRNSMIGTIVFIAGEPAAGMLRCDGSTYLRADYPVLYDALAPVYHIDSDSFRVPNLVNRFLRGAADSAAIGGTGGAAAVTLDESQIPPHSHTYVPPVANVDLESPGAPDVFAAGVGLPTQTGTTGGGLAHENQPPYEDFTPCVIAT